MSRSAKRPRARRTGISHRVGAFSLLGSGPSLCPGPMPQGQPALTFVDSGGRHPRVPQIPSRLLSFPSRFFSKHKTLYEKSLICGICSGSARYYNLIIVKPGAPHPPPRNSARLFYSYRASPMLLGVSYVHHGNLYIRNIIPLGGTLPRRRSWPYRGGAMQTFTPS